MSYASDIDDALDVLLAGDPTMTSFDRHDIAAVLGVSPDLASTMLQVHRASQHGGWTRHVVVARGYARGARWFLLSAGGKPGQRLSLGQAAYIAKDLSRRAEADINAELVPATASHPAVRLAMQGMIASIEAAVTQGVKTVNLSLQLVQATQGIKPDLTKVP